MERIPTCPTSFVRRLHICADDTVADGTFALALQSALHIPSKCNEPLDNTASAEYDDLEGAQPRLPILLGDADSRARRDSRGVERVAAGERNGKRDGW